MISAREICEIYSGVKGKFSNSHAAGLGSRGAEGMWEGGEEVVTKLW
jgi:hypothetical protein